MLMLVLQITQTQVRSLTASTSSCEVLTSSSTLKVSCARAANAKLRRWIAVCARWREGTRDSELKMVMLLLTVLCCTTYWQWCDQIQFFRRRWDGATCFRI